MQRSIIVAIVASAVIGAVLLLFLALSLEAGKDASGMVYGRDFLNLHLSGQLLEEGKVMALFDNDAYMAEMRARMGSDYSVHHWSYPPTLFWLAEALGRLPYHLAFLAWTLGGATLFALALWVAGVPLWLAGLGCLAPASVINVVSGQNGLLTAAILVFALVATVSGRAPAAGLAWAVLTIKPHLGVIVLPYLVASRRWAVIGAGALVLMLMLAVTLLRYGQEPWVLYFGETSRFQRGVLESWEGVLLYLVPSVFMQGRLLGLPIPWAYALQGVAALVALWLLVRRWPGRAARLRDALTWVVLGTFAVLPYSFVYDLVVLQAVLLLWAREPGRLFAVADPARAAALWCVAWFLPVIGVVVAATAALQVVPFVLLWILWRWGGAHGRHDRSG